MTRRLLTIALLGAAVLSPLVSNAQVSQQGKTAATSRAIDDVWARADAGLKRGDAHGVAALYTEDAIIIDPSSPTTVGRAQLEANLKQAFASIKFLSLTRKQTALDVSGDLAVETGTLEQTIQESGKAAQKTPYRYILVLKNVNGKWLVLRDIAAPMSPTSPTK